jgi:hypothetical protein
MPYHGTDQADLEHLLSFLITAELNIEQGLSGEASTKQRDGMR